MEHDSQTDMPLAMASLLLLLLILTPHGRTTTTASSNIPLDTHMHDPITTIHTVHTLLNHRLNMVITLLLQATLTIHRKGTRLQR
jgi:hypothetical protein